jgi:hypothetical protein
MARKGSPDSRDKMARQGSPDSRDKRGIQAKPVTRGRLATPAIEAGPVHAPTDSIAILILTTEA